MRKLKCFIACAFGKDDVDEIYKNAIDVALRNKNIEPFRVDMVNHNKKIDQKIIELIEKSDFGISDLTYSRPSVYYESGLLEGQEKPVIYLARKDHFDPKINAESELLKIHFDLITQNIIIWESPNNELIEKIEQRISLITQPILKTLLEANDIKLKKIEFNNLSQIKKLLSIKEHVSKTLRKSFSSIELTKNEDRFLCFYLKKEKKYLLFLIMETFSKTDFNALIPNDFYLLSITRTFFLQPTKSASLIFISLRTIRNTTLDSGLFWCQKSSEKQYVFNNKGIDFEISIIDKIEYLDQLSEKLNNLLIMKNCS